MTAAVLHHASLCMGQREEHVIAAALHPARPNAWSSKGRWGGSCDCSCTASCIAMDGAEEEHVTAAALHPACHCTWLSTGADGAELSLVTTMPHDALSVHFCKVQAVVSCEAAACPTRLTQAKPHLCRRCLDLCSLLAFQIHHARLGGSNEVIEVAKLDGT